MVGIHARPTLKRINLPASLQFVYPRMKSVCEGRIEDIAFLAGEVGWIIFFLYRKYRNLPLHKYRLAAP